MRHGDLFISTDAYGEETVWEFIENAPWCPILHLRQSQTSERGWYLLTSSLPRFNDGE